jgi:hypothetical protein
MRLIASGFACASGAGWACADASAQAAMTEKEKAQRLNRTTAPPDRGGTSRREDLLRVAKHSLFFETKRRASEFNGGG